MTNGSSLTRTINVTQDADIPEPVLTVSPASLSFGASAGSQNVTVTSNVSWSASDNATWITVTPGSGTQNGTVAVTVAANLTTSSRTGTVTISDQAALTRTVNVTQAASGGTPVNDLYQGENFTLQSGGSNRTDFGVLFFDFGGNGSFEEWNNVNVPSAGTYTLTFRYGNGSGANRQCALTVNSIARGNVAFTSNTDWAVWQTVSVNVPLNSGNNTVRIAANTASGGPNLDYMQVTGDGTGTARIAFSSEEQIIEMTGETVMAYPNPVRDYLTVRGIEEPTKVYFTNVTGIPIEKVTTKEGVVDVSDLAKGFYLLRVKSHIMKVIKE